ncbi:MAG: DUF2946 family protein [Phycisphaerales bacterium]
MARVRTILLLLVASLFATGTARTVHMFADHTGDSACVTHVEHANSCDHGHHHDHEHDDAPEEGEKPDPHDHQHDDSCELCAVLASIASNAPAPAITVEPATEHETPLLTSSRTVLWTSADRSARTSRGPPATA